MEMPAPCTTRGQTSVSGFRTWCVGPGRSRAGCGNSSTGRATARSCTTRSRRSRISWGSGGKALAVRFPLRFEQFGIFARGVEVEAEVGGCQNSVRLRFHVALIEEIRVPVIVAEEF